MDEFPRNLPPLEFGKPWAVPGFDEAENITGLLLNYKIASVGLDDGYG